MSKYSQYSYLGNPKLRRAHIQIQMTQEELDEYQKCMDSPIYFIKNYVKIISLDKGIVNFDLYPFQEEMVETFDKTRFSICKIPRQSGKSITTVAYFLWKILFEKDYNIAIVAHKGPAAMGLLGRLRLAYENLPMWLQHGIIEWNKGNIELENGSKISAWATTADGLRSGSFNCITGKSEITIRESDHIYKISIEEMFYHLNVCGEERKTFSTQREKRTHFRGNEKKNVRICQKKSREDEILWRQNFEVLTDKGFKKFVGIKRKYKTEPLLRTTLISGHILTTTPDHLFMTTDGWKKASEIQDSYVITVDGNFFVENQTWVPGEYVYDLLEVEDTHSFYANDILIHNCILLDEFAFVPNNIAEAFFTSTYPVITAGKKTKIIIISTPKGMNHFYTAWMRAEKGLSNYAPISVHWSAVPGRDEKWKEETIANTSEEQFKQEFETEFIGSSATLINATKLQQMIVDVQTPIEQFGEHTFIYEKPIDGHTYCVAVDVSEGLGLDSSALSVIDVTQLPYKQVAVYKNSEITPMVFPTIIHQIATNYNEAYVLVEINSIGLQVADILHYELSYENLIRVETKGRQGQINSPGHKKKIAFGLKQSKQTKIIGCSNLKALVENNKLVISDMNTVSEFTTFVMDKNTYKAEDGCHDDLALTLVNFGWLTGQKYFKESINSNIRAALQKEILDVSDSDMLPAIGIDNGLNRPVGERDTDGDFWVADRERLSPFEYIDFDTLSNRHKL